MQVPIEIDPHTFLREHCPLPALPGVVHEIQNVIRTRSADIDKVAYLISGQPALAAQVLKVVNSAYYSLPKGIGSVNLAVACLGLDQIYRMVLFLSVINTMAIAQEKELRHFWFHSFYTALCTKYLALRYEPHLPIDELRASAILHDIGKLVYLKFFPQHYRALRDLCKEHGCLFSEAETSMSLPSSASLGTLLCDHWRLPEKIRQACKLHTVADLSAVDGDQPWEPFERMICLGNLLALISTDEVNSQKRRQLEEVVRNALRCSEEEFLAMMRGIFELKTHVERFLDQLD